MIDAHHGTATKADQGKKRRELTAVGPSIKDADFCLGWTGGSVNDGFKHNAFLEQVTGAIGSRNGCELVVGGGEADALSGEGEEGFKDPAIAVGGKAVAAFAQEPVVQEYGRWDRGVIEKGKRELADVEVPVRMAGPLNVEEFTEVELQADLFASHLVGDGAVVYTPNGDEPFAIAVAKTGE